MGLLWCSAAGNGVVGELRCSERALRVQRIHKRLHGGAVKDDHVLDRLLSLSKDVDDVLGKLATKDSRDRRYFADQVLEETAQKLGTKGFAGLDGLGPLLASLDVDDSALVLDQVAEDEAIEAVTASSIECFAVQTCGGVDDVEGLRVKISRNDNVVSSKVAWPLGLDALYIDVDADTRVELLKGSTGNLSSILSDDILAIREKELGASVGLSDSSTIK
ncbi:hypothetical protein HG530_013956 [Fusarium avenaceum]|nr:hypothetical protein HG530_013956 [Fusarium avenaceum]